MRSLSLFGAVLAFSTLAACGAGDDGTIPSPVNDVDPYIARALNDPLMVDPDLSYRNEANAAVTVAYDHALPSFKGSEEAASRARETARLELLEDGQIVDLPLPSGDAGPADLSAAYGVQAVLAELKVPEECAKDIAGSFSFAASMPEAARIMPHGMVRLAAAVDQPECKLRLVRYVSPVGVDDALQYHFNLAQRAKLSPVYFTEPEKAIIGERRGTYLRVNARETAGDLSAVDVITWTRG
ncbi:MAG: hypothetical protein SXU28_07720 [Pseudomonadota bacterium]|nr:hypothetical protein [Pseudomonadota bacterium]